MDSQVAYPRGDEYEKAPSSVGQENEEPSPPQQKKKSVLKKAKAKAKKLKDTLTKQSNSHGHGNSSGDGDHVPDDHDLDEEDDADEEMEELDQRPELPINKYGSDQEWVGNVKLSEPVGLEDDPNAPMDPADPDRKPTHQVKVTDPAGQGSIEEAGVNPLIRSFEKMNVETDPEPELQQSHSPKQFAGSHDQFSPEADVPNPTGDESSMSPGKNQSSYTQKFSAATSAITDRAISAKNMVASKLGYGEKDNQTETHEENPASSAIADKAVSDKNVVASKLGYGEEGSETETQKENSASTAETGSKFSAATSAITDRAVTAKNLVASKLGYGEKEPERETPEVEGVKENSASTAETGSKFSAATSAITDRAVTAKNLVASKLGYGEKEPERETPEVEGVKETSSSPVQYGKNVVNTVYEKVAGAGTTVASKMRGTTGGAENEGGPAEGENKGGSVKNYLSEKLKPGEEDKALSEIISGALHKSKEENDPSEADPAVGKVTESEEVKKKLGEEGEGSGSGKGMVGMIKDTVGSWMGRSGSDHQASPPAANSSAPGVADTKVEKDGEERRVLQESTY